MLLSTIKNIPVRVVKAFGYSWSGIKNSFIKEESFRLEMIALAVLIVVLICVPWPFWKKAALLGAFMLIPLTELLNSAIEDLCDLLSPQWHPLVKAAKDKGSAAVLLAVIFSLLVLGALLAA